MKNFSIVIPDNTKSFTDLFMLALCVYREARGEAKMAKEAVGWVVRNRVEHPSWWGSSYFEVITKPYQFSSFNKGEVNSIVFGPPEEKSWKESVQAAFDVICSNVPDHTAGSTFYFDKSLDKNPPKWAAQYTHMVNVGSFRFYKPK